MYQTRFHFQEQLVRADETTASKLEEEELSGSPRDGSGVNSGRLNPTFQLTEVELRKQRAQKKKRALVPGTRAHDAHLVRAAAIARKTGQYGLSHRLLHQVSNSPKKLASSSVASSSPEPNVASKTPKAVSMPLEMAPTDSAFALAPVSPSLLDHSPSQSSQSDSDDSSDDPFVSAVPLSLRSTSRIRASGSGFGAAANRGAPKRHGEPTRQPAPELGGESGSFRTILGRSGSNLFRTLSVNTNMGKATRKKKTGRASVKPRSQRARQRSSRAKPAAPSKSVTPAPRLVQRQLSTRLLPNSQVGVRGRDGSVRPPWGGGTRSSPSLHAAPHHKSRRALKVLPKPTASAQDAQDKYGDEGDLWNDDDSSGPRVEEKDSHERPEPPARGKKAQRVSIISTAANHDMDFLFDMHPRPAQVLPITKEVPKVVEPSRVSTATTRTVTHVPDESMMQTEPLSEAQYQAEVRSFIQRGLADLAKTPSHEVSGLSAGHQQLKICTDAMRVPLSLACVVRDPTILNFRCVHSCVGCVCFWSREVDACMRVFCCGYQWPLSWRNIPACHGGWCTRRTSSHQP